MTYDQWIEKISKEITLQSNENSKDLISIYDIPDENYEEEELPSNRLKKKGFTGTF